MEDIKWFKVFTDVFGDDKIKVIRDMPEGDSFVVMWFQLLALAGKSADGGYIYFRRSKPYTTTMLASVMNRPQSRIDLALKLFVDFEMIDIDENGYIFVTNWEKHQSTNKMEKVKIQNRLRQQEHRKRKKMELLGVGSDTSLQNNGNVTQNSVTSNAEQRDNNVMVTLGSHPNNATEIDKEVEVEVDKERSKQDIYISPEIDSKITEKTIPNEFTFSGSMDVFAALKHYQVNMKGLFNFEKIRSYQGLMEDQLILAAIKMSYQQADSYCLRILTRWNDNKYRKLQDLPEYNRVNEQEGANGVNRGNTQGNSGQDQFNAAREQSKPGRQVYERR